MNITDGAILFVACMLSFGLGYVIGAVRVTRFVSKELRHVGIEIEQQRQALQQFISRLGENEKPPQ
jgi:hypothetical protein